MNKDHKIDLSFLFVYMLSSCGSKPFAYVLTIVLDFVLGIIWKNIVHSVYKAFNINHFDKMKLKAIIANYLTSIDIAVRLRPN